MPIVTELVVSVVGGVLTAIVLAMFSRGSRTGASSAPTAQPPAVQSQKSGPSAVGDFFRIVVAVIGGVAIAMVLGRVLIQTGIAPKGLATRLVLLVFGTAVVWLLLSAGRRR